MAQRFWVGSGTNWSSTSSWSAASGGASGASVPGSGDDAIFDSLSGNATLDISKSVRSVDFSGTGGSGSPYTGTFTHTAGATLTLGTTTTNGSLSLKMVSGMTYTLGSATTSAITFASTSGTQEQITSAGKTLGNVLFNGASGSWISEDGFSNGATATVTLQTGTLNLNNQTFSWGGLSSSFSSTRALTFGTAAVTITSATGWSGSTATGMTLSMSSTSSITFTGASPSATFGTLTVAGQLIFNGSGTPVLGNSAGNFANVTRTGTAAKTDGMAFGNGNGTGNFTITTLTLNSNSAVNRLFVSSGTVGATMKLTVATLTCSGAIDFMDMTGAGAATWSTASGATYFGDCGGNSGITMTAATSIYGVSTGTVNWSTALWSTSSGGGSGARVPLPQDTACLDGNSGTGTYTVDMPRSGGTLTCTGFTGTLSLASTATSFFGSFTLSTGMTLTLGQTLTLQGRSSCTITSAGQTQGSIQIAAFGGTYTMQDNLLMGSTRTLTINNGTVTLNGTSPTIGALISSNNNVRAINLGSGTLTLSAQGTAWNTNSTSGLTLAPGTSTIVLSDTSSSAKSFAGGGMTYNNLTIASNPGGLLISGANTFNVVTVAPQTQITWPVGITSSVTSLIANGQSNPYLALPLVANTGTYVSSPAAAPVQITGNLTIDTHLSFNSLATSQVLAARWGALGNESYMLRYAAGGTLVFYWTIDGSTTSSASASVSGSVTAGTPIWIRVSFSATTNPYTVKFYTSSDGATWTQAGSTATGAAATSVYAGTAPLEMGSEILGTGGFALNANLYEVRLYNSALGTSAGTPAFDANFATKAFGANSFIESSTNAATVTLSGAGTQVGDGRVQMVSSSPGTQWILQGNQTTIECDYAVIQDSAAVGSIPFYAGVHSTLVSNNTGWVLDNPRLKPPVILNQALSRAAVV